MSLRDDIRAKVLGAAPVHKTVTVEHEGVVFVLRSPTISQRSALVRGVGMVAGADVSKLDPFALMVDAIILLTYDTQGNKLFEPADKEVLLNQPVGAGLVDVLGATAMEVLNLSKRAEDSQKN